MSTQTYRSYDDFSEKAIYNGLGEPSNLNNWVGWTNDFNGNESSTPITDDNLNAMLNMLIYIRNVIGLTTDFATEINGTDLFDTQENGKEGSNSVYPNPDTLDNRSIAKYLEAAFNAIIGQGDDLNNTQISKTLSGLKSYLESLDESSANYSGDDAIKNSADHKWASRITQTDGKVSIEYTQPDASDITYNKDPDGTNLESGTVDAALDKLDTTIGNLDSIKFEGETATDTVDNLIAIIQKVINERIEKDTDLDDQIDDLAGEGRATETVKGNADAIAKEIEDRKEADKGLLGIGLNDTDSTIKKNEAAIAAINDETTGILAQSKNYTDSQIKALDFPDTAVAKEFVTSVLQTDGKISIVRKALEQSDIPDIDHEKISDFDSAVQVIKVDNATNADKAVNDGNGKNIASTYATKEEVSAIELLDSKVKMSDNLRITEKFGRYSPDSNKGYVDITCRDKTVREFLLDALRVTSVGTIDYPSYTYSTGATSRSGEVGSSYSAPTCTFKVTDVGSYQYGPATGIVFNGTLKADNVSSVTFSGLSNDGTASITAEKGGTYLTTSQTIEFTGNYTYNYGTDENGEEKDPIYPNTNIETVDETKYIPKKTDGVLSHSCTYTGYYKMFMGIGDANNLNSNTIRALTSVNMEEAKTTKQVNASINDKSIIWAIRKDFTSNKPTFKYELFGNYETLEGVVGPKEVAVKNGGGVTDVVYNVYTYTPAAGKFTAAMKTQITIN